MAINTETLNSLAMEYVGTPHVNGGNIKGAGLDCSTLPANFFHDLGYGDFEIMFGYSGDWYCKRNCEELLLPYLKKYCRRIRKLMPGDILLCGHTHTPCLHRHEGFTYVNPGSVSIPKNGTPHSYCTLEGGVIQWKDLAKGCEVYDAHKLWD